MSRQDWISTNFMNQTKEIQSDEQVLLLKSKQAIQQIKGELKPQHSQPLKEDMPKIIFPNQQSIGLSYFSQKKLDSEEYGDDDNNMLGSEKDSGQLDD